MALTIQSNYAADVGHRYLKKNDMQMTSSLGKLASGTRVLSAKDDAASMAVGNRLAAEVAGLRRAGVNASQAVSMMQVGDGAQANINDMLIRMKSLAVQASSAQLGDSEREMIDVEVQAILKEIDRIADDTDFSGQKLVNGDVANIDVGGVDGATGVVNVTFQGDLDNAGDFDIAGTTSLFTSTYNSTSQSFTITLLGGAGGTTETFTGAIDSNFHDGSAMETGYLVTLSSNISGSSNEMQIALDTAFQVSNSVAVGSGAAINTTTTNNITELTFKVGTGSAAAEDDITVSMHGVTTVALGLTGANVRTADAANLASQIFSEAVDDLGNFRALTGANQNRLEFAAANLATVTENTEAARSSMLDLDVAAEMSYMVSRQILVQSGVSMLAQANQMPQNLLRLFQ